MQFLKGNAESASHFVCGPEFWSTREEPSVDGKHQPAGQAGKHTQNRKPHPATAPPGMTDFRISNCCDTWLEARYGLACRLDLCSAGEVCSLPKPVRR